MRALAVLPKSVTSIDLLAQLKHVARIPSEEKDEFDVSVAFMKAAALDRAGRYAEAWECAMGANQKVFAAATSALSSLAEERRQSLAFLQSHSDKNPGAHRLVEGQPVSLFILGATRSGKTTM